MDRHRRFPETGQRGPQVGLRAEGAGLGLRQEASSSEGQLPVRLRRSPAVLLQHVSLLGQAVSSVAPSNTSPASKQTP